MARRGGIRSVVASVACVTLCGCEAAPAGGSPVAFRAPLGVQEAISDERFAELIERVSEPEGFFDTDNLISNEAGYLNVMDALDRGGVRGGAYVGVGPDQNFSYIAQVGPEVAFITDVRRDNLLHHLLLKALIERAPTRVDFLATLHGRLVPGDPDAWTSADAEALVDYVDRAPMDPERDRRHAELSRAIRGFGVPLSSEDVTTIRRFHESFMRAGLDLRFTSFGRPPRAYYPTYRRLLMETDADGDPASYLATPEAYRVVRSLHRANRIIPVVGDLSGPRALSEIGAVMQELGVELTTLYTSNVEYYLWQTSRFDRWRRNLRDMPVAEGAVLIRSYFPNSGARHPSAIPGYYATQSLQPVETVRTGDFGSYWDLVTRDVVQLR